jgi:hypothetical protein
MLLSAITLLPPEPLPTWDIEAFFGIFEDLSKNIVSRSIPETSVDKCGWYYNRVSRFSGWKGLIFLI